MTDIGPRGPASTFWADPRREERLREMVAQGMTSSLIASAMGCSRNSVIGKKHRLGLSEPRVPVRSVAGPRPAADDRALNMQRRIVVKIARGHNGINYRHAPVLPQPPAEPAGAVPKTAVTLMGLTERTCRWPLWQADEPKLYCGGDVVGANGGCWDRMGAHSPYCGAHFRMAHQPARTGPSALLRP